MRPLKFKSFCQVCNKFVDGNYRHAIDGLTATCPNHQVFTQCQVIQFTGLKDREGKEIWEGDIIGYVGVSSVEPAVVIFNNGVFGVDGGPGPYGGVYPLFNMLKSGIFAGSPVDVEILGNIHENGDLLK